MAAGLDVGLLASFKILAPALLVWVITFMMLEKLKILGDNRSLHAIIGAGLAFLVIISRGVSEVINYMSPWFVLVFIFVVLLMMIYRFMGVREETMVNYIEKDSPIKWLIFFIALIIIASAISNVYGQGLLGQANETAPAGNTISAQEGVSTDSYSQNVMGTIFHKKILGMLLVMLIGALTIALLTRSK